MTMFPLEVITVSDIRQLYETLWSWKPCPSCEEKRFCEANDCSNGRRKRLTRFLDYYKDITRSYAPAVDHGEKAALETHEDLFRIIRILKDDPNTTRAQFAIRAFQFQSVKVPKKEQEKAIDLAVRIFAMVSCVADTQAAMLLESGPHRISWRQDIPFSQFMSDVFPMSDHPSLNDPDSSFSTNMRKALMARKLKKHAKLSFRPTDDIRSHLKLDHKTGIVQIFHYTAFLKEHLHITKDSPPNLSVAQSLGVGALPRQLVLETLDSIQDLLFPLTDPKSRALLQSLTSTRNGSFDPDCLRFDSSSIRRLDEKFVPYYYLGERLIELYSELENPRPRGAVARWLERRSHPRYVMLATLIGVMIAVLLGLAGLAVTIFQTWIAYQSWKHPVQI